MLSFSERPQNSHTPLPLSFQNSVKISAHSAVSISLEAISHGSAKIDKIDNFPPENKMCQNVISSSSKTPFSPEFISRQVPADHPEVVPFSPPAYADWHYANPTSNAADPKSEEAALKSAQASEWRDAM